MYGFLLTLFLTPIVIVFIVLGVDFAKSTTAIGYVSQGRSGDFVRQFGEEKDGCISFINTYNKQQKVCGDYNVTRY